MRQSKFVMQADFDKLKKLAEDFMTHGLKQKRIGK